MEESAILHNDEVIADSENEDENEIMGGFAGSTGGPGLRQSSPFSAFPPTNQHYKLNTHSSISNFTAGPTALADYSSRIDSSERAREKGKDTDLDTSITSFAGMYSKFDDITSSIADRAKTRQRPKNHSTSLDVIELTTEDEDELSLKHSKSRPKPKLKIKIKPIPKEREQPTETPTSIKANPPQAVAPAPAPPRPRPRPRPRVKRPVPETEAPAPVPPTSPPPPELPIATSPPRPGRTRTSQLPPSDPPPPSPGTAHNVDPNTRAPPIDVLFDGPLSSPSSLFSDSGITSKKRRGKAPGSEREIDQLASSQDPPLRLFPAHIMYDSSPHGMPPPPTFFAGSSSSSIGRERHDAEPDTFTPPPPPEPDVVDLTMLPPTMVPVPKPKPKKPKKKVDLSMFDENFGDGMIVLDEDNQDDDFDPLEEGSSKKKKTKAKTKEKPTKSQSKAKSSLDGGDPPGKGKIVEVLLDPRPPSKGKGKAKASEGTPTSKPSDKGKKKKESSANKEVFKSSEFVDDSDDELDSVPRVGHFEGAAAGSANTLSSVTSVKVNAKSKAKPPAPLSKSVGPAPSKPKEHSPARSLSPLSDLDFEMDDVGPSTTKRPAGGAKRKSVVDSDGEDDDFTMAVDEVIRVTPASTISAKKRKTETAAVKKGKSNGKKKGKNVVLSDEDHYEVEEEAVVKTPKLPKASAKQTKKVIHDDEDEEAGVEAQQVEEQQSTPEQIKENVVPTTSKSSVAPTPRPSNIPRPTMASTNSEHKTPIYARYEIAPRKSSLPMSELIRRANSMPGSPFPSTPSAIGPSRLKGLTARTPLSYSPLLKSSRSMLSRIAPLHPNRRTPPPPPPPPPPRKKTKKELELEEKWEEEMVESVGGVEAWAVLGDDERREIRKAKWAMELGGWDE